MAADTDADTLIRHGLALYSGGRLEEALYRFDRALVLHPKLGQGWNLRGLVLWGLGRKDDAVASFAEAAAADPGNAEAWNNHGAALQSLERPDDALASYDKALRLRPLYADALFNRGNVFRHLSRFEEALRDYSAVLAIHPDHPDAWNKRGRTLWDLKRAPEALASFDRALALQPAFPDALHNRGKLLWLEYRRAGPAIADLAMAVQLDPECDYALGTLHHLRMHAGLWGGAARDIARINAGVRAGKRVAEPFVYQAVSQSPADLHQCAALYAAHLYPPTPPLWRHPDRQHAQQEGRLRIGYLSGEFRQQATALLMAGLYEQHDRARFEIFAFDNGRPDASPTRKRLEAAFDHWVDISGLSDQAAAESIAEAQIDILVNLNGYFGDLRMGVFARKPAPLQVNYLGFPGTLGAPYIDYILADRIVIADDEHRHYSEKVVTLPGSYQANDSRRALPAAATRAAHHLPQQGFVFCNFNQSYKLTPEIFALWMRLLRQTDGSVLWLLESNEIFAGNLRRTAESHGVAAERLVFAPEVAFEEHLARLPLADLFLDTLPYNAHTTASDALWIGVPLLTCRGKAFAGRVGASLLTALGLPELICENLADYESEALALAHDRPRLAGLRQKLAGNAKTAPLFDSDTFRRGIEAAYTGMWELWRSGESPRAFTVP